MILNIFRVILHNLKKKKYKIAMKLTWNIFHYMYFQSLKSANSTFNLPAGWVGVGGWLGGFFWPEGGNTIPGGEPTFILSGDLIGESCRNNYAEKLALLYCWWLG
jgi:hypothetical protein